MRHVLRADNVLSNRDVTRRGNDYAFACAACDPANERGPLVNIFRTGKATVPRWMILHAYLATARMAMHKHVLEPGRPGTLAQSIEAVRADGHIALIDILTGLSGVGPTTALMRGKPGCRASVQVAGTCSRRSSERLTPAASGPSSTGGSLWTTLPRCSRFKRAASISARSALVGRHDPPNSVYPQDHPFASECFCERHPASRSYDQRP